MCTHSLGSWLQHMQDMCVYIYHHFVAMTTTNLQMLFENQSDGNVDSFHLFHVIPFEQTKQ